jgi:ABC-type Fe3+-hydroxamate transport system substrate-binding protein
MKRAGLSGILILLVAVLLSACASSGDDANTDSSATSPSTAAVPGEKMGDEGAYAPGAPGSAGSVRW